MVLRINGVNCMLGGYCAHASWASGHARIRKLKRTGDTTAAVARTIPAPALFQFDELDKRVLFSTLACAGASLTDPLMSLVDTAFVGQLGVLPLAALGPNTALFNVVFFAGFSAFGVVATNIISHAHGLEDRAAAGRGLVMAALSSAVLGLLITAVLIIAPEPVLRIFQTNAEMMPYARPYCVIRAFGVVSALMMTVFQAAFRAIEDMCTPLAIVLAAGIINAVLDPFLIFSCGMGVAGAAWATSISQIAGAAAFVLAIVKRRENLGLAAAWAEAEGMVASHLASTTSPIPHAAPIGEAKAPLMASAVAATALPLGSTAVDHAPLQMCVCSAARTSLHLLSMLSWDKFLPASFKLGMRCMLILSTWTLCAASATHLGTVVIAAYQIMQQVLQLQLSVCWAFLAVGQSMVSVAMARATTSTGAAVPAPDASSSRAVWSQVQHEGRIVGDRVIRMAVVVSGAMAVGTYALRTLVPRVFTSCPAVLLLIDGSALLMCGMLALSWNNAVEGVLMGASDSDFVINIYPPCVAFFVATLFAAGVLGWGMSGIWSALLAYYVGLLMLLSGRYWWDRHRVYI